MYQLDRHTCALGRENWGNLMLPRMGQEATPAINVPYRIRFNNGEIRKGTLDEECLVLEKEKAKEKNLDANALQMRENLCEVIQKQVDELKAQSKEYDALKEHCS